MEGQQLADKVLSLKKFTDNNITNLGLELISHWLSYHIKILAALKANSKFPIMRMIYEGRNDKYTAVMFQSLYLTVFVNINDKPDFVKILEDFEAVISTTFGINENEIQHSKCVRFVVPPSGIGGLEQSAGFVVEILPAVNLVHNPQSLNFAKVQLDEVTRKIARHPTTHAYYRNSLVEDQLGFMRQQTPFTQDLVRLAKFWYKSLFFGEYIPGGITIIELIAVCAAKRRVKSLHDAFIMFLSYLNRLDHLRCAFYTGSSGGWDNFVDTSRASIPPQVLKLTPSVNLNNVGRFILEPANPSNDFLTHVSIFHIKKFMVFARDCMDRFKIPQVSNVENSVPFIKLCNFFRPLPTKLINADQALHLNSSSADYLCGYECRTSTSKPLLNPAMIIRNPKILRSSKVARARALQNLVTAHMQFIATCVTAARFSGKCQTPVEIVDSVCQMIDRDIRGIDYHNWQTNLLKSHDDYDVTYKVPINGLDEVIKVSVRWDPRGKAGSCYKQ